MVLKTPSAKLVAATALDIKHARLLAGNDKRIRDRAVKSLRRWFEQRTENGLGFTESDLMLIWKGLFYSMWMSDKPLIQEECTERISSLTHALDASHGVDFFAAGMRTLGNEWFGIDQWRMDKFLMLVRRLVRHAFQHLQTHGWRADLVARFVDVLTTGVLDATPRHPAVSLAMHFSDVYLPELAKVTEGALPAAKVTDLVAPFARAIAAGHDARLLNAFADNVFRYLVRQSTSGLRFEEKFHVWRQLGFPGGHINALQRASADDLDGEEEVEEEEEESADQEEEETGMDARAGRVDVVLSQLRFSCKHLEALMGEQKAIARNTQARRVLGRLASELGQLAAGEYPYGMRRVEVARPDKSEVRRAAAKLVAFEKKIYAKRDVKKRKRKVEVEVSEAKKPKKPKKRPWAVREAELVEELRAAMKEAREIREAKAKAASAAAAAHASATFARNSGTWFVYEPDSDTEPETTPDTVEASGEKKVTIDLRLNRSQEVHEHVAQLRSSPAIPFDAARSPGKSVIKPSPITSPINPFYKRRSVLI